MSTPRMLARARGSHLADSGMVLMRAWSGAGHAAGMDGGSSLALRRTARDVGGADNGRLGRITWVRWAASG